MFSGLTMGIFYRFLTLILPPFTFRVFFRRIFYSNLHRVPLHKPLLFAGNHQNSFTDGMLVGAYLTQPINFLMRADMFRNAFARFCLKELNVSPVYRFEEGLENVHRNRETFKWIYDVLKKNGNYVVFSEGICVQEKRLQKLRKGTGRMAFGAEEEYGLDVHIVPVGINYTYPSKFRKEVLINFDDAFSIKELKSLYETNKAKALIAFNEKVESGLKRQVIIVNDPENDLFAEQLLMMARNNTIHPFFRWRFDDDSRRIMEKGICDKINSLAVSDPARLNLLKEKTASYWKLLQENGIRDENIARRLDYGFLRYFALFAGFPLFVTGYAANLIPYLVPRIICNTMIKDLRFYSSVYMAIGTILYLIYFPVAAILSVIFLGWWGIPVALSIPLLGYAVLFYQEIAKERYHTFRYWLKKLRNPRLVQKLSTARAEIIKLFDDVSLA